MKKHIRKLVPSLFLSLVAVMATFTVSSGSPRGGDFECQEPGGPCCIKPELISDPTSGLFSKRFTVAWCDVGEVAYGYVYFPVTFLPSGEKQTVLDQFLATYDIACSVSPPTANRPYRWYLLKWCGSSGDLKCPDYDQPNPGTSVWVLDVPDNLAVYGFFPSSQCQLTPSLDRQHPFLYPCQECTWSSNCNEHVTPVCCGYDACDCFVVEAFRNPNSFPATLCLVSW